MARDRMDDNKKGLSPEELEAIFEQYENGEISEEDLADAINNASVDNNFTDDFTDPFFTEHANIDPNSITEESVEKSTTGISDDDTDDPFNGTRNIHDTTSTAGSGKDLSKKQKIEKNNNNEKQKESKPATHGSRKRRSISTTPGKQQRPEDTDGSLGISRPISMSPFKQNSANGKQASQNRTTPFDDNGEQPQEFDTLDEINGDIEDDLDDQIEEDVDESVGDEGYSSDDTEDDDVPRSPFSGPVSLSNDEKNRITPGKRSSSPGPFDVNNTEEVKSGNNNSNKDTPAKTPFGDPSGLGDNAKDANIGKTRSRNLWEDRFAALSAAEEERRNEEQENSQNLQQQGKDQSQSVPQNKKKKNRLPLILALLLPLALLFPLIIIIGGTTMINNQGGVSAGICTDDVDGDDISGQGTRGVPKGEKSNPEIMPPGILTSGFGPRWGTQHKGQDLATGGENVGIYAYYDGVVSVVCQDCDPSGFGSYIIIDHDDDGKPFTTLYGHMYSKDIYVKEGDTVAAGQKIALQGNNGGSTGPHLHFEVGPGASGSGHFGSQVDPAPYLENVMNPTEDGRGSGGSDNNTNNDNNNDNKNDENKDENSSGSSSPSQERSSNTGKGNAEILNEDKLKTNAKDVAHIISDRYPEIKTIGGWREFDEHPDHPSGLALDIMIPNYNTPEGEKLGTEINDFLLDNADKLQTNYTIWRHYSYHLDGSKRWVEERGSDTANHMDHVHVLLNGEGNVVDPEGGRATSSTSGGNCCGAGRASSGEVAGLTDDENNPKDVKEVMKKNAATIISMGQDKNMSENSIKALLAIANKQSGLRNLANKGENFSQTENGGTTQEELQKSLDKEHDGITNDSNKLGVFLLSPSEHDSVEDLMDVNYQSGLLFDRINEKNIQDKNANDIAKELGFPDGDYEGSIKDIEKYYDNNKDDAESNAKGAPSDNSAKCESIDQGDSSWSGSGKIKGDSDVPDDLIPIFNAAAKEAKNDFITPALLAAIAYTENGFKSEGCSGAGACGMMQFMPAAWAAYGEGGLENRNDPEKAARAAVKHLDANYDMISGWEKEGRFSGDENAIVEASIAGYNGGPAYADKNYSRGCGVRPDDKPGCWPSESEQYVHKVKDALNNFSE